MIVLSKIIYQDTLVKFIRQYTISFDTTKQIETEKEVPIIEVIAGLIFGYHIYNFIINNISDADQFDRWSIFEFVVREFISYIIQFYNEKYFYCLHQNIDSFISIISPIKSNSNM
jgi:hypothetical protein